MGDWVMLLGGPSRGFELSNLAISVPIEATIFRKVSDYDVSIYSFATKFLGELLYKFHGMLWLSFFLWLSATAAG